jgi:PAS domain S-box-containing protein
VHQELHLQRTNHRLAALSRIHHTILRVRGDKEQLLQEAGRIIYEEMAYSFVWLGELMAGGEIHTRVRESSLHGPARPSLNEEIDAWAARIARTVALEQHPRVEHVSSETCPAGVVMDLVLAAFPAPLSYSDLLRPTLVLVVGAVATQEMDSEELRILQELTGDLGFAVDSIAAEERSTRAEEALRISEERFRRLAEHSLVGIVLIQNDLYRYVNPAFVRMFGYDSPREIIDRLGPFDLAAPESREIVAENVSKRISGQVRAVQYQYRGLRKDGTYVEIEEHGARTIHAQRLAVIATVMDVTARETSRRRLEALSRAGLALARAQTPRQALERASEQVAEIWPCAAVSIVLMDQHKLNVAVQRSNGEIDLTLGARVQAGATLADLDIIRLILERRDSVITSASYPAESTDGSNGGGHASSPTLHREAGVPLIVRDELIGFIVIEAAADFSLGPEDAQHLRLFADHVAATYQHLHLISHLEEERNRLAILNQLSHTLSEALQLQDVVERAVQQTSRALEADICLLYLWDTNSETLVAVAADGLPPADLTRLNSELRSQPRVPWIHWLTSDQDLGSSHWALVAGMDPETICTLDQALEARGEALGFISFLRQADHPFTSADVALVSTLSVPIALAIQNVRYYERITYQAELKSEALRRQEELDLMKDELIQNISHELRTPLALVMGYAEMLDGGHLGPISPEQSDAISVIARRSRMLSSLVEDISLLWNVDRTVEAKESIDLRATVEMAVRDFAGQAEARHLEIHGEWTAHPVIVNGVPIQLRRVLDNLIGNSLKFTPPGGAIDVRLWVDEDCAALSVTDTGIGVAEDKLYRIFDRFYQVDGSAKRRYGGTGLGLALVKAIVEAHKGTIQAVSGVTGNPERPGLRITVRLPLRPGI